MGSSGTGKFSDYSRNVAGLDKTDNKGSSGEDPCNNDIITLIEEVERSQFYEIHKSLPPVATLVLVSLKSRLTIDVDGETIGFLPSQYNYLAGCIKDGFSYSGKITSVTEKPVFRIKVQIHRD